MNARPWRTTVLLLLAASPLFTCRRPQATLLHDLAREAHAAEATFPWPVVLFGTPYAEIQQRFGFQRDAGTEGEMAAAAAPDARVSLGWGRRAPRAAILEIASQPGTAGQAVEVFLNEDSVARVTLAEGRRRYRIELPRASQRRDDNDLRFVFARGAARPQGAENPMRFFFLAVGPTGDARLARLLEQNAPPPLAVLGAEGRARLVQMGPGVLKYALRLPAGARLRFTPETAPEAARGAALRVSLEVQPGVERELWRGDVVRGSAGAREVEVPLPTRAGAFIRLGLHVDSDGWGVWRAPRVVATGAPAAADPAAGQSREQDALRRSLAGSSVLLIVLDAAGARHFGCYGYSRRTTPEIDRIASDGVVFERAYTTAVFTRSAMASVWTSQYPEQHHAGVGYDAMLPADRLTLAELLSSHGVRTAGFIANPSAGAVFGLDRGFAEFRGVFDAKGGARASRADAFAPVVVPWLEARAGERFFAYLHVREPHFPYDPPPPFDTLFGPEAPLPRETRRDWKWLDSRFNTGRPVDPEELAHLVRLYDGNLAYADHQLGELRRRLEALGVWDRTVVILTADHGEALHEHGLIGHNEQVYEETARIPLIIRFPKGRGPRGMRVGGLVDLVDVAPTVADVFGLLGQGGSARSFKGLSLLAVATGAPGKPATVSRTTREKPVYAFLDDRFKLVYGLRDGAVELYDLVSDPGERTDLSKQDLLRTEHSRQALYRWLLWARPEGAPAPRAQPGREDLERLRALGYVQ